MCKKISTTTFNINVIDNIYSLKHKNFKLLIKGLQQGLRHLITF